MCIPAAAAGLIISTVSAAVSYVQQDRTARQHTRAIYEADRANLDSSLEQERQVNSQATDQKSQRTREAMIERGRLRVIAAESGLEGGLDRIERASMFNEGYDIASIESNRMNAVAQVRAERAAGRTLTGIRLASVQRPSLVGTGLQVAGAVAEYGAAQERTRRRTGGGDIS
jgi:hypothetical protein